MLWWIAALGLLFIAWICLWRPARSVSKEVQFAKAKKFFHTQRERLEAKFINLASSRAKADAPKLADCNFADDVAYVRNRSTGELSAFVAVSVSMDDSESRTKDAGDAVSNLQLGTAVFRFDRDHWETDGRTILNLNPSEAIRLYRNDFEKVGEEFAHHS
jgi:hypothetical protein